MTEVFRASRWTRGNFIFPTSFEITEDAGLHSHFVYGLVGNLVQGYRGFTYQMSPWWWALQSEKPQSLLMSAWFAGSSVV